ncbi:hypothetical protein H4219_000054 [Mycoemilia scoparia]|uniref:AMMECR1 domain-containing protein n=1 Tax=Mycoemilia scoparia TaxID=417184 RepID=A0A9W8A7L4_9FUNG|nr:hypothetical protein H4219_000054 [Mycoemilia scoparia]
MKATQEHCQYCFDVLLSRLFGRPLAHVSDSESPEYPLFVSWHKNVDGEEHLRGCVGTFTAQPLYEGLRRYAIVSSMEDSRFRPINKAELGSLTCEVSLLTDFEDVDYPMDWEIGKHGVWIEFVDHHGRSRTATFLPHIAKEQGWTKLKTMEHLLRKGGFRGEITPGTIDSIKLTRYQSSKASLTYDEYVDARRLKQHQADSEE